MRGLRRSSRPRVWVSCSTPWWCSRTIRWTAPALGQQSNGIRLGQVEGRDATHYPLALIVQPGEQLRLRFDYRPDLFDRSTMERSSGSAWSGCLRLRWRTHHARSAAWRSWMRTSAPPSWRAGTTPRSRSPATTLPSLFAAQAAAHPGCDRGGVRGPHAQLRGARCACQPAGAASAEPGRWPRDCGGSVRGALARDGGGSARHPQGGRRLSAARSELSARAARLHAGRCRCAGAGHAAIVVGQAAGACHAGPPRGAARCRQRADRAESPRRLRPSRPTRAIRPM